MASNAERFPFDDVIMISRVISENWHYNGDSHQTVWFIDPYWPGVAVEMIIISLKDTYVYKPINSKHIVAVMERQERYS